MSETTATGDASADTLPGEVDPTAPLADEADPHTIVSSEVVFEGRVWNVRHDVFQYNDSQIGRDYIDHPGAVAVLALDDDGQALLIQQYRHPIATREWELPAGLLDVDGEPPLEAAKRELAEEVDLEASQWSELVTFHTSPGGSNEVLHVYLAQGLSVTDAFDREEEEADIVKRWVPLQDAIDGVLAGRLQNSILMIAVLAAHARR